VAVDYPALLTPAAFSEGTGRKIPETDPRLKPLIDGATRGIRRYCGWHIAPKIEEKFRLDGPGGRLLPLKTMRLANVTSVTERGQALADDVDFEWSENGELRRLRGCWTDRYRAIVVEAEHGFDDAPDVAQIIQQVVANAIASPLGATREQAGAISVQWATTAPGVAGGLSLLERDMAILNSYRLPGISW
jgi:hypothetical protein